MSHKSVATERDSDWNIVKECATDVAPGVHYVSRTLERDGLTESVHLIEIDPLNGYAALEPVSSLGKVVRLETVGRLLQETESRGRRVVAGVNGDFFSYIGVPSGLQIVDGEIITSPAKTKVLMAVMADGTVRLEEQVAMQARLYDADGYILNVDMVNRTRTRNHTDHAFAYTWRFGDSTRTPDGGVEAVIASAQPAQAVKLVPGEPWEGVVASVAEGANTAIDGSSLVLSAVGAKADELKKRLAPGKAVRLDIEYDKGIHAAKQVISGSSTLGFVLLRAGEVPDALFDRAIRLNSDRHPRTMLATRAGKLYMLLVDGRQPGFSNGMTLAEGAQLLQQLGMEHAINLDGGGSTTCYVRLPGEERAGLMNRPSDGYEREVGNALAIVSTAPLSELEALVIRPGMPQRVLAGSSVSFTAKGHDRYYNAVPITSGELVWSLIGKIGTIGPSGEFMAGAEPAEGTVTVRSGGSEQSKKIQVTDRIHHLSIEPATAVVEPGGTFAFQAKAYDEDGEEIALSQDRLAWTTTAGSCSANGVLHALSEVAQGVVTAAWGDVRAEAAVHVGKPHLMIADFESLDTLTVSFVNAVPHSVTLVRAARPSPVRFGTFSGKLSYDFTNTSGGSRAVVEILNAQGEQGREIEGEPYRFGLWVYGDGAGHWLRVRIRDATGHERYLNFTEAGGLDWIGWKYVHADIPKNTLFPIRVHHISLSEPDDANKSAGTLYLDDFRAEYVNLNEDVEGPVFSRMRPEPDSNIGERLPLISVVVQDAGSGVEPSTIRLWIDGEAKQHQFDYVTGVIVYQAEHDLEEGEHRVVVEAADRQGNSAVPTAAWSFAVKHQTTS
ncbi:phosphodiester glycosidase family protein [Paenibacillus allorhizosphaerae]|uniref:Phosphodiester glycosidase domain-containing protein n=1 Tax=Paenibacillus allorhizosphaerae TaxID=2849866 RepID=A0ABM8VFL5_9BACL|nr:phosphodiester glycosidase family protein [Paenibacillus allorhizosphaerae]CAG7635369.1 hypothetical protein PAECIP111802_02132 [Paenibacillus allorhizosphaerae]